MVDPARLTRLLPQLLVPAIRPSCLRTADLAHPEARDPPRTAFKPSVHIPHQRLESDMSVLSSLVPASGGGRGHKRILAWRPVDRLDRPARSSVEVATVSSGLLHPRPASGDASRHAQAPEGEEEERIGRVEQQRPDVRKSRRRPELPDDDTAGR